MFMAEISGPIPSVKQYTQRVDLGENRALPVFNIKNGVVTDARPLLVPYAIPAAYHWVPMTNLPPELALQFVEAFVKCAMAHGVGWFPTIWDAAKARRVSICLGVARATTLAYYRPAANDFIADEVAASMLEYINPPEDAVGDNAHGFLRVRPNLTAAVTAILTAPLVFTAIELEIIGVLVKSGIGAPVLQGWSLINTDHNYLSDNLSGSRRAFLAVERQFWKGTNVTTWMAGDVLDVQDMVWHKANHPLHPTFKKNLAQSPRVRDILVQAHLGSIAARLPALEAEVKEAKAYLALFRTVDAAWRSIGGELNYQQFEAVYAGVEFYMPGNEAEAKPNWIPDHVTNRETAIAELVVYTDRAAGWAAHCLGFYEAMTAREDFGSTGDGITTDSIMSAWSLKKLRESQKANFMLGKQAYSGYQALLGPPARPL